MSEVSADRSAGKRCLNCQHLRTASDPDPIWSCPKCGRVYAKLEKLQQVGRLNEALAATNPSQPRDTEPLTSACPTPNNSTQSVETLSQHLIKCPDCEADVSRRAENCPKCGAPLQIKKATAAKTPHTKQLLGIIGSIILFIGVFTPIISGPIIGNMNFFHNGKGYGTIVLALAVTSLILVLTKEYKGLWFTGLGSFAVMLFTFINFQSKMSQAKAEMESQLAGNPFRGLADVAMQSVQLQWGWAFLIVGAALLIASAVLKEESK